MSARTKRQKRHEKRLAERRRNEDRVHKQVVLDWLYKLRRDADEKKYFGYRDLLDQTIASFQEEFDFWPEQLDDSQFASLIRGPREMARTSDPSTSKKAAYDVYPRVGTQREKALIAIILSGVTGMHYAEVERETGIRGVWKRLSELQEGGWIKPEDYTRRVSATGSQAQVYVATVKALESYAERINK